MFDWDNKQNGALIGSIGIVSALLQGGYVRRAMGRVGEGAMARRGASACAAGLVLLALVPVVLTTQRSLAIMLLRGAAVCMAFTSATVVNALTAYASLQCDDGVDADTAFYVLAVLNAGSILGRVAPAMLSDACGRFNILAPSVFCAGLATLVFWPFARSVAPVMVYAATYGFFSGAFNALIMPCIAQVSEIREIGSRIGMLYSIISFP